jgi:predicted nucleic acid-binding protein
MASYYFDTSALVKWYVTETGTRWVSEILSASANNEVYTVRVTAVEVVAALAVRSRVGSTTEAEARAAIVKFRAEFEEYFNLVEVTQPLVEAAMTLAEAHGLRGYDAVQLAAALAIRDARAGSSLPSPIFVSADRRLNNVAVIEDLTVENPNDHS